MPTVCCNIFSSAPRHNPEDREGRPEHCTWQPERQGGVWSQATTQTAPL